MKSADMYLSTWQLIPELCLYEEGEPPVSGTYKIESQQDGVQISISWETADGTAREITFGGPTDGSRIVADVPGITHFSLTRIDRATLDSVAYVDEQEVSFAQRRVSDEGDLLTTIQTGLRPDGTSFRNFQVYRKQN